MPTIIDSLIVTLGLDATKFHQGQKETQDSLAKTKVASSGVTKEMEEGSKKMAEGIVKVRNELLTLLSVFAASVGFKDFAIGTFNNAANLGLMATNLGMSTEKLKAFQQASVIAGGTTEGITNQIKNANVAVGQFQNRTGFDPRFALIQRYGGNAQEATKSGLEMMLQEADVLARYKNDPSRQMAIAGQFGIDDGAYNLLKQGRAAVLAAVNTQGESSSLTGKEAAQALEIKQRLEQMGFKLGDVSSQLLLRFAPVIDKLSGVLDKLGSWLEDKNKQDAPLIGNSANDFVGTVIAGAMAGFGNGDAQAAVATAKRAGYINQYDDPRLNAYADEVAARMGLPAGMLNRIKNKGERTNSDRVSSDGARGVMQFLPSTWNQYGGGGDPQDPYASIYAAGLYFKDLNKRYHGNEAAMVAEYIGGTAAARKVLAGQIPSGRITRDYLARVEGWTGYGNSSAETNIGSIIIQTKATDSPGIAKTIGPAIHRQNAALQANNVQQ